MFDIDNWNEIFNSIKKNKMRTFLTGFAVSWGIFMFCILLSAGNGLRNGTMRNFESRSTNSVEMWGRRTSMDYEGIPRRRPIRLDERDIELVRHKIAEAGAVSGTISRSGNGSYGSNTLSVELKGVDYQFPQIEMVTVGEGDGRFISEIDVLNKRKVAVINKRMKEALFNNEDPLGKSFLVDLVSYTVIGVYEASEWGDDARAFIPISTAQIIYRYGWGYDNIVFALNDVDSKEALEDFETAFRKQLAELHYFHPDDRRAIGMWNRLENYLQTMGLFNGISLFIWMIGIGTLVAGIIGVSNIMLITVRERTREIGIRKALGAKPRKILGGILMESVFITALFGYIGLFLGIGFGELASSVIANMGEEVSNVIYNPTIDLKIAFGAMGILLVSGLLAGYFPAVRAVNISPIEAMRME